MAASKGAIIILIIVFLTAMFGFIGLVYRFHRDGKAGGVITATCLACLCAMITSFFILILA